MFKINDIVWFIDTYDNLCTGIITEIYEKDKYCNVKMDIGHQNVLLSNCYTTKEKCIESANIKSQQIIYDYMKDIQSLEDLIRFMYNHCVAYAEEYTDWEAREAACQKANDFGITLNSPYI